jgi:hypothetical protein
LHNKLNDVVDKVETGELGVKEANEIIKEISKAIKVTEKRLKESRRTRQRAALVELAGMLGGAGINTGAIPTKTLRETALVLSGWGAIQLRGGEAEEIMWPDSPIFIRCRRFVNLLPSVYERSSCTDQVQ